MLVHLMCMFVFLYSYISGSSTLNLKLFFHHKNVIRPSNSINEKRKKNLLMVSMQFLKIHVLQFTHYGYTEINIQVNLY